MYLRSPKFKGSTVSFFTFLVSYYIFGFLALSYLAALCFIIVLRSHKSAFYFPLILLLISHDLFSFVNHLWFIFPFQSHRSTNAWNFFFNWFNFGICKGWGVWVWRGFQNLEISESNTLMYVEELYLEISTWCGMSNLCRFLWYVKYESHFKIRNLK